MIQPDSTYRVQLSPEFTFRDLSRILDYLDDLGISTIYSAPFFQANKGSTHGYDVIDPFAINSEIGTLQEFKEIGERMNKKGMTWIQDIVPNHMAFSSNNPWLRDIFEIGPESKFYNFFDIDWDFKGLQKVITPFLGSSLEEALNAREIKLELRKDGIFIIYYDDNYPVSLNTYIDLLQQIGETVWVKKFHEFKINTTDWIRLKDSFFKEVQENSQLQESLLGKIDLINRSVDLLEQILEHQYFILTHWKKSESEINYRRFFTINSLICLRMEDIRVFQTYHIFIKELSDAGLIQGLRIDHIDGLFDPHMYLHRLRELMGDDFYIIVEKILESDEKLPGEWPVQGTSGYDFLAQINHLFTNSIGEGEFTTSYHRISPKVSNYESLVYSKKLFILKQRMGGELHNLWKLLLSNNLLPDTKPDEKAWKEALAVFLAAFPVYRIYPKEFPLKSKQLQIVETAYKSAIERFPEYQLNLDYLKKLYAGEAPAENSKMLYFLQRCQQFSGPLAAKGVEDTSFYIYNRLIAHNEVGDSPENFGLTRSDFHKKMIQRKKDFPLSVNATATHDTKRGEDTRMRLLVLSEIAEEWFSMVKSWEEINSDLRSERNIPDKNEEYFIYQTLLGSMPYNGESHDYLERTNEYLKKVLREAKIHTNWAQPNETYESHVFKFIGEVLNSLDFRKSFDPFLKKIAGWGAIKSIGQTLLKITSPGIPDIYQGTELWDFSYVDPDNRRPVDYAIRTNYMADFRTYSKTNLQKKIYGLKNHFSTGKIKMYVLFKALQQRRKDVEIYQQGNYIPLKLQGRGSKNFIAYARVLGEEWRIIVVPVYVTKIFHSETLKPLSSGKTDIFIQMPKDAPAEWDDVYTGAGKICEDRISLKFCFTEFPVAIFKNRKLTWT